MQNMSNLDPSNNWCEVSDTSLLCFHSRLNTESRVETEQGIQPPYLMYNAAMPDTSNPTWRANSYTIRGSNGNQSTLHHPG